MDFQANFNDPPTLENPVLQRNLVSPKPGPSRTLRSMSRQSNESSDLGINTPITNSPSCVSPISSVVRRILLYVSRGK